MSQPAEQHADDGFETTEVIFRVVDVFQKALDGLSPLVRRRVFSELFKSLPEREQVAFLSGLCGLWPTGSRGRSNMLAVNAARLWAVDIAERRAAVVEELKRKEVERNRKPDSKTVQIAREVERLRTVKNLSWINTAREMKRLHPEWFPGSVSVALVNSRCQKAYRRVIEGKKS